MTTHVRIQDFDDVGYDPFSAAAETGGESGLGDIYPELARLRRAAPVQALDIRRHFGLAPDITTTEMRKVVVLGYAAASEVLGDAATYSNLVYNQNLGVSFGRSITTMDSPEHPLFRHAFQAGFMKPMLASWGETIVPRMIDRLIDDFADKGRAELVGDFTLHFPFHFIHELMQLPLEDRFAFQKLAFAQVNVFFDRERAYEAIEKLKAYLTDLVHARRDHPVGDDDFVHAIANARVDGERLPDEVVIAFFRQLMNAGGDTSYHGFSTVLTGLLTHPDQLEAVRADRSLVSRAIEEGLRWNCPVPIIQRTPLKPAELAGVEVRPGDRLDVVLAAANRDEQAYNQPDVFDIHRPPGRHLAFGYGAHICLGQHLARMEMGVALNALFDRLPNLRLDTDRSPPVIDGLSLRGPHALHVRFNAQRAA
ncbi:cytochrome P450 [Phenylobacterium sp. LjRoot225]|uniref:cytochrome P450 n=1 Tax=Phenylobacterium sp. LjRoot225 TaxID=3342285 RepID=UPI003ECD4FD2